MRNCFFVGFTVLAVSLFMTGCSQSIDPSDTTMTGIDPELQQLLLRPFVMTDDIIPSPLVTVDFGENGLTFWPFTADDFSGMGKDPINLIFFGHADPLDIRAALLSLDGDRSSLGMDPVPPFNDVWDDEIAGDIQASYGEPSGWSGGCVQLTCGEFGPLRFHLRLFKIGGWTVGNVHFEMQIPGTSNHQVLSWEVAEQFVIGDFIRSGLLDSDLSMMPTPQINPLVWRTIPAFLYNELPVELRELIGGPTEDVTADVDLESDGSAMILNLADRIPWTPEVRTRDFVIQFGQVIPKPFCSAGPDDYVYVEGPVLLSQSTSLSASGIFQAAFRAEGQLSVTPVDPSSGTPIGESLTAEVFEHHNAHYSTRSQWVSSTLSQHLLPDMTEGAGRLFVNFKVRSKGRGGYMAMIRCADNNWVEIDTENKPAAMR